MTGRVRAVALGWVGACAIAAACAAPAVRADTGAELPRDRIAVVIGNSDYQTAPDLPNAILDADSMADMLHAFGFRVFSGHDLDRRGFEDLLREVMLNTPDGADLVFYFAGHGIQIGARNYLLPVDVAFNDVHDLPLYSVTLDRVIDALSARGAVHVAIIDACRENPFPGLMVAANIDATLFETRDGFEPFRTPLNSLVAFATAPGETARDGAAGENSPYTAAILNVVQADPAESVTTLLGRVREEVYNATGGTQIPWESSTLVAPFAFSAGEFVIPAVATAEGTGDTGTARSVPVEATVTLPFDRFVRLDGALADAAGGRLMRLNADNRAALLADLTKPYVGVVSVTDKNGRRLDYVTLPAPSGQWRIIGEGPIGAEIHVRLSGVPRRDANLIYTPDAGARGVSNAAGALWAQRRVSQLSRDPADHDAMVKLAQDYQVASPSMAFLVLETPWQYVQAEIVPPIGYDAEWMEEYSEVKADSDEDKRLAKAERFDWVLDNWEDVVLHWEDDFDIDVVMKRRGKKRAEAEGAVASAPPVVVPVSPPRVNPPLPAPPRPVRDSYNAEEAAEAAAASDEPPPPPEVYVPVAEAPPPSMNGTTTSVERLINDDEGGDEVIVTGTRRDDTPTEALAISAVTDESGATIEVADLLADRPYLDALKAVKPDDRMRVLEEQEKKYGSLPGFYFDTAEFFRGAGDRDTARILLLSALELPSADEETMTIVAFRLQQVGEHDLAVALFERLAANAEFRPQPKRSLALALIARAKANPNPRARQKDLERAFVLLTEVALNPFSNNYDGIDVIALMEANAIIPLIEEAGGTWSLDKRLVRLLDTDVRIVIEWTNGDSDLDLWVIEPTGERAYYSNQETDIGGKMSDDMTRGFGPEHYFLRRAADGEYEVIIDGYASDRIRPNGPGRVMVRLIRDFGRPTQSEELVDVEINFDRKDKENERAVAKLKVAKAKK